MMEKQDKNPLLANKAKSKRLSIRRNKESRAGVATIGEEGSDCVLPSKERDHLWELFSQIENKFEKLYAENAALRERIEVLTEKYDSLVAGEKPTGDKGEGEISPDGLSSLSVKGPSAKKPSAGQLMSQKLKTYKASTSRIVSSFKIPNQAISIYCNQVLQFSGHKDGVWEVSCARNGHPLIGSASADRTARIWHAESGQCLLVYQGHNGSVNSLRFHPTDQLVCSGAGDGSCHVWKAVIALTEFRSKSPANVDSPNPSQSGSADEQDEDLDAVEGQHCTKLKVPMVELTGHEGPVVSADWWSSGKQVVTASWDRLVKLWDLDSAKVVHTLEGHEMEITHACTHPLQKLIVTSSQDTTFRLWDFRLPSMHSVNVFQGHTDIVTSAVFTSKGDHVVSGSDDRTVKIQTEEAEAILEKVKSRHEDLLLLEKSIHVWDLKNMRSPLTIIRLDSPVNRIAVSPTQNIIAIPHDNRQVRLFDLNGNRLSRLPRRHRQGHQRMVCSASWYDDTSSKSISLATAGFDKLVLGWTVAF